MRRTASAALLSLSLVAVTPGSAAAIVRPRPPDLAAIGEGPTTTTTTTMAPPRSPASPPVRPVQPSGPGDLKTPGVPCYTTPWEPVAPGAPTVRPWQPPDGVRCPERSDDDCYAESPGVPFTTGACLAARRMFYGGMAPRNWTEACIIQHESGGSYSAWNPRGYYGRYQYDHLTWVTNARENGDRVDSWGDASGGEQDWNFVETVARDHGYGPWVGYDGC